MNQPARRWPLNGTRLQIDTTDADLLRRASQGDEAAFASLYRARQGAIYRFALQMSGSTDAAEDIVQEVFMTLAGSPDAYDPSRGSVLSYLFGIARKQVLRWLERGGQAGGANDDAGSAAASPGSSALDQLVRSEEIEAVRRAVLSLPATYREAVVLCDLQEMSYQDAARVLDCPVGTVRSKLNRGRALLYEKLQGAKRCCV